MRKILLLVLLFSLSNLQAEENALPEESSQEILSKNIEIEESVVEEILADELVNQLEEMVNEYKTKAQHDASSAYGPSIAIGPDTDLSPVLELLGKILSSVGRVTDRTSLRSTVLGILGDPNSVLGTDYTVVQALKEIIDFLDTEHAITNANTPYIISTPGKYTVIEYINKDFSSANAITIQSDDVTLNLSGHTIADTAGGLSSVGIKVDPGYRNLVIDSGSLIGFEYGILAEDNINNVLFEDLIIKLSRFGIYLAGTPGNLNTNVIVRGCLLDQNTGNSGSLMGGLSVDYTKNIKVEKCFGCNNTYNGSGFAFGFSFYFCELGIVENSVANENIGTATDGTGTGIGFYLDNSSFFQFLNCEGSSNGKADNTVVGVGFYSYHSKNNLFKDCIACNNYGEDYDDNPINGGGLGIVLSVEGSSSIFNCITNNNHQVGISLKDTSTCSILNNQVINNGAIGIDLRADLFVPIGCFGNMVISNKLINNGTVPSIFISPVNINLFSLSTVNNVFMDNNCFMNLAGGVNYIDLGTNNGLSISNWSLAGIVPVPTWQIDNFNIIP